MNKEKRDLLGSSGKLHFVFFILLLVDVVSGKSHFLVTVMVMNALLAIACAIDYWGWWKLQ